MPNNKILIDSAILRSLYLKKNLSAYKIAEIFNCSEGTVRARLRESDLPIRTQAASLMKYKKFDFSGDLIEKAYLIGFRLGDLNVYCKSDISNLIVARCNTTQKAQIVLMKKLFSRYGKVTVSLGMNSTNINCFLNRSFSFLLPKHLTVPGWIKKDGFCAAAFIAGYTDAEGNFLINQTRARFKIDAYDYGILLWMSHWLQSKQINVKFRCIGKKGELRSNGSRFNQNLWRLSINELLSLTNFIDFIKPFIRHKTRMKHINICELNLKARLKRKIKHAIS